MKPRLHLALIWLLALPGMAGASRLAAADIAGAFDAANKLYEQGKFTDAASAYEKLLQAGPVSPTLYFNLGNAFFKSGQIGRAIVTYRQAEQLTPRDPDVRANLQFARNQVQGPSLRAGRWERWLDTLTLNEWAMLAAAVFWLICVLQTVVQFRPQWQRPLRVYSATLTGAAVVIFACLAFVLYDYFTTKTATVTAPEVVVRSGPFEESQSAFTANDGAAFTILDRKDDWLQVSDGARRIGWLKREQVAVWPEAHDPR